MPWANEELGRKFGEIAELLKLSGADRFRVRAYERARDAINGATVDLGTLDAAAIAELPGIGGSTADKIVEFQRTGQVRMLDDLRAKVPPGIVALVRLPGAGPKTARLLHDQLGGDALHALGRTEEARVALMFIEARKAGVSSFERAVAARAQRGVGRARWQLPAHA